MARSQSEVDADRPAPDPSLKAASPAARAARELAARHAAVAEGGQRLPLLAHPEAQRSRLDAVRRHYSRAAEEDVILSYAGEWLLDNYYLVQQALRQVYEDLPDRYYDELPALAEGALAGLPRIYAVARSVVSSAEGDLDLGRVEAFLGDYQQVTPLTMGELWALPAMLRIVLLENLTVALIGLAKLAGETGDRPVLPEGVTPDALVDENTVSMAISALRTIANHDWAEFFEAVSRVEAILRQDPAGVYDRMDFDTRNRYRGVVEGLAANTGQDQERVARQAVDLARQAHSGPPAGTVAHQNGAENVRARHVGTYLIGHGRPQLEAAIGFRPGAGQRLTRWLRRYAVPLYLAASGAITAIIVALIADYTLQVGGSPAQVVAAALLTLLPASATAIVFVNWAVSQAVPPRTLPKLDFSEGIPPGYRAAVVVPALLTDGVEIDSLVEQLELHYLRNPDPALSFALLADYTDAPEQHQPGDEVLAERARAGIAALNTRYGDRFVFLLRERRWNPREGAWMGWERKRGKLAEFNRLLLGRDPAAGPAQETSYQVSPGDLDKLHQVRYVVTLDADTVAPRGSVQTLVGTLAHPLNRARFDPQTGQVIDGYTILQPRVEIMPTAATRSLFAEIFAGDTGLDLYTLAVSNVYQDLFGEGIYVGKGIYDVAAFERSLAGRVPENALLSHDLFEGIHGRAGLATDIVLLEDYPPHYLAHTRRLHRWIRGDWQLLPWLWVDVPRADGRARSQLSLLDRWKLFDNLRRSLVRPSLLLLLVVGWLWLPGSPLVWTVVPLLLSSTPFVATSMSQIAQAIEGAVMAFFNQRNAAAFLRWFLSVALLPYEALLSADAIATTLFRLVQRKKMLQWTTAAQTVRALGNETSAGVMWEQMFATVLFVASTAWLLLIVRPMALLPAMPLLALWLLSPGVAHLISRPQRHAPATLSPADERTLRTLARRTWLYYEEFVGPEEHWLPPDHYQEQPRGIVAHHTSPTNIGLLMLTTLGAYDLGYVGLLDLMLRLRATFETIGKLERHRGHLLNWYDTRTLQPLPPRYVSTVDSGNLAGSLLALKQGCQDVLGDPVVRPLRWQGVLDTLAVLGEVLEGLAADAGEGSRQRQLEAGLKALRERIDAAAAGSPLDWPAELADLTGPSWEAFSQDWIAFIEAAGDRLKPEHLNDLHAYLQRASHYLANLRRDVGHLLPWLPLLADPPRRLREVESEVAQDAWRQLIDLLRPIPALSDTDRIYAAAHTQLRRLWQELTRGPGSHDDVVGWCEALADALGDAQIAATSIAVGLHDLTQRAEVEFQTMSFGFLFDERRKLFHIGYNVDTQTLDNSYYDLLASEARLASFIAIARNEVPQSHWLHLSRPVTVADGAQTLLSWSGTMFEYLMPMLLMRTYEGTLLNQSYHAAVGAQMGYVRPFGTPWGISESGYYAFDSNQNYQYRAFGVPHLAFKRGLHADLVITPYASLLALPIRPREVMANLARLRALGALNTYGLYEAVDYTPARMPLGADSALVREVMVHHQGMIFLTLVNHFTDRAMVRRFHADPRVQSVEMLLQEQIPQAITVREPVQEPVEMPRREEPETALGPWNMPVHAPQPRVHLLSNGRYSVIATSAGGGVSRWKGAALTRWRADATLDDWGSWVYVRDLDRGALWSAGYQPTAARPDGQTVLFTPYKAEYQRRDHDLSLNMEVVVAPDDDVELRRITLTNHSGEARRLLLTSYAEVTLSEQAADRAHPAFNKMFIESEALPELGALLFRRRPRTGDEAPLFAAHMLIPDPAQPAPVRGGADRARFLGRSRTVRDPQALAEGVEGDALAELGRWPAGERIATLDPIMALGQEIELAPYQTARIAFATLAADSRRAAVELAGAYRHWAAVDRAFDRARYEAEQALRKVSLDSPALARIDRLLGGLLYPDPSLRPLPHELASNTLGQPALWAYGISGDYPILLIRIRSEDELELVQDALQAHEYWRTRGVAVTLAILNQHDSDYDQALGNRVRRLIVRAGSETWLNRRAGIFLLRADQMAAADRSLLQTAARVVLDAADGPLAAQVGAGAEPVMSLPPLVPTLTPSQAAGAAPKIPELGAPEAAGGLLFDNGWGGFSPDGREYVITLPPGEHTPAPWINVVANDAFGFIASESGTGPSWAVNSGENRLTSWRNDPVTDMPSEAIYLRDEETGEVWSPTPLPARADAPYTIRHRPGVTTYEHSSHGLRQRLERFLAGEDPVSVARLRLENTLDRPRRITVTFYAEWVLGTTRDQTQQFVVPDFDAASETLLARNPYSMEFPGRVAFVASSRRAHGLTTDRTEFLGRMGSYALPAGLTRIGLAGTVQAGIDPCAAYQVHVDLPPGAADEVLFLLGQGADRDEALALATKYRDPAAAEAARQASEDAWRETLESVSVETPDPALNVLLPWLLYQALSCRIRGRTALYQSSGAYGFRDQLQDVMALIHARPEIARTQILRAARHQFEAGDVLHWWHPPAGKGVRTRISDDLLWLPYVVAEYVEATGDTDLLREEVPFLVADPLGEDEDERYGLYEPTAEAFSIYEHCRRALGAGSTHGPRGLPLMGAGDWNDGMNRVGIEGRGESVWLAWFLIATMQRFLPLCAEMDDADQADVLRRRIDDYRKAVEEAAWDGEWYLRAFYDDGTPLGSSGSVECQIDSIAQSWAVLSGAADPHRADRAMQSVIDRLLQEEDGLLRLFTPPFDATRRDPGYIKGYPPGVRENGGQYTHAAMWSIWAFAGRGDGDRAMQLFDLLNPIHHAATREAAARYGVEPYVVAADIYSEPPHTGRGGWTWYTGSAGWMYRLAVEAILGLQRTGAGLRITPAIPSGWPGFTASYRYGTATYHIEVTNPDGASHGVREITVDGAPVTGGVVPLVDDGAEHEVRVVLGK